jgi:hypothetical protein
MDNWQFGQVPMMSIFIAIFLTFFEGEEMYYLFGNIYIFSIGPSKKNYTALEGGNLDSSKKTKKTSI